MDLETNTRMVVRPPGSGVRWHHWTVLLALLLIGTGLRFYRINKTSLWPDEFWSSVHLATGRGTALFDLPTGVLIDPPPKTLLDGAPPWWHIWSGLRGITHPPLYLVLLRWWMDAFGSGDFSTRTFSALCSLAAAVVLFDVVGSTISPHAGLIAASLLILAPMQINLSQETRPYPLLELFGLLACRAVFRLEKFGASPARLIALGLAMSATALTHYFSFGALLAIFLYVLLRIPSADRRKTLAVIGLSALFVLLVWSPFLWQQRQEFLGQQSWSLEHIASRALPWIRCAAIPSGYIFGRNNGEMSWITPAVIAYLLPLFLFRRYPPTLLCWIWIICTIGSILIYDCVNHARLLMTIKYVAIGSVAFYALCSMPVPGRKWWRWAISYAMVIATAIAAVQRIQEGPLDVNGDWRGMALDLDHLAGPNDPLVFYPDPFWGSPGMFYLAFAHYARDSHRPIMYLNSPADPAALAQLAKFKKVWLVGPAAFVDGPAYLPGWAGVFARGYPASGSIAEMVPPTSPKPSRPEPPGH